MIAGESEVKDFEFENQIEGITNQMVLRICKVYHLTDEEAVHSLESTQFFNYLIDSETELYKFDVDKLFDIYQREVELGKIYF